MWYSFVMGYTYIFIYYAVSTKEAFLHDFLVNMRHMLSGPLKSERMYVLKTSGKVFNHVQM